MKARSLPSASSSSDEASRRGSGTPASRRDSSPAERSEAMSLIRPSPCSVPTQDRRQGKQNDLQVQPDGPVLNVENVYPHHFLKWQPIAPRHLPKSRDAG